MPLETRPERINRLATLILILRFLEPGAMGQEAQPRGKRKPKPWAPPIPVEQGELLAPRRGDEEPPLPSAVATAPGGYAHYKLDHSFLLPCLLDARNYFVPESAKWQPAGVPHSGEGQSTAREQLQHRTQCKPRVHNDRNQGRTPLAETLFLWMWYL